jgi:hypothetical protein
MAVLLYNSERKQVHIINTEFQCPSEGISKKNEQLQTRIPVTSSTTDKKCLLEKSVWCICTKCLSQHFYKGVLSVFVLFSSWDFIKQCHYGRTKVHLLDKPQPYD